jgi:hypothetical protein
MHGHRSFTRLLICSTGRVDELGVAVEAVDVALGKSSPAIFRVALSSPEDRVSYAGGVGVGAAIGIC